MRKYLLIPAALILAGCGTSGPAPEPEPSPVVVEDTFTPPPVESSATPGPLSSSPEPTDAPKLLDTAGQVFSLKEIDPAIAQAHGFLATDYYPLVYDPTTYCSVEDLTVCGTSEELWLAFEEDFDQWVEDGGMEPQ